MIEIIQETLIDSVKLLPFLFFTYLLMEYIEHKTSNKTKDIIKKSGKVGPAVGGLLGVLPQCGFSVAAANFYAARVISLGTLIAIFLATSDEMIPVLLANGASATTLIKIVSIKVVIGIIAGFCIDFVIRKNNSKEKIHDICEEEHCHCEKSIWKSTVKHTLNIFVFVLIVSLILNTIIFLIGEDNLSKLFTQNTLIGPIIAGAIGLIPNCASSVVLTELYMSSTITLGMTIAGLLSGAGVGILVLFKVNKNIKENIQIVSMLYLIGVICGVVIDIFNITI